jgi:predicted enzyme related to lactoylglutathione lyase
MSDLATADAAASDASDTTGKFFWYELMTSDQDAAIAFYTRVVGWTSSDMPMPGGDGRYTIMNAGGRGVGGVMQITAEMKAGGAVPAWLGYVHVADADASARAIAEAGGKVMMGPADIPDVGRFALANDPGGASFYVMAPFPRDDAPPPLAQYAPGNVGWHELYAADGEASAIGFYGGLFGWTTASTMDMGEMGTYRLFATGGEEAVGGMMDKPAQMPAGAWQYYFNVDAIDAAAERVKSTGGQVIMGPMEVPNGMWVLQGLDPQGAHFALVAPHR